jgi:FAD/FMN-containing dehydrogenase
LGAVLPIQGIRHNQILIPGAVQYRRLMARHPAQADPKLRIATIDLTGSKSILAHRPEDQVISVETGITLSALAKTLAEFDQWLPVSYGDEGATLVDAILTGDGGPLEHFCGGLRRLVLGLTVDLSDGRRIRTGGQVVKNVTGYDTTKIFVGSHGYLGVPVEANLRLFARPHIFQTNVFIANDPSLLIKLGANLVAMNLSLACLDLVSFPLLSIKLGHDFSRQGKYGLFVRVAGRPEVVNDLDETIFALGKKQSTSTRRFRDPQEESEIWRSLAALSSDDQLHLLDLAVSRRLAEKLLLNLSANNFGVDYRLAFGRFRLYTYDLSAFETVVATIRELVEEEGTPAVVSYPTEQGNLKILYIGDDSKVQLSVLKRLKSELDPQGVFNPFIEFG